ncbi:rod shape-determining protein RodA [Marinihelvus fidelis]|uniref:Peptidoglycan glycosyltransferase MrdB n=1 Tax=Marinihelvus fidelis TaxID=2613842 RepID=A0A5N0T8H0_9GAMM|nr:rod shape-determining protein RodA [Marinihelvus fidelis]KAA9131018.1 rod shape-determining protein RodA [Marinihelvus fidelis]
MRWSLPGLFGLPRLDLPLLLALLTVMGGGLFVLYSASGEDLGLVYRQALRLGVGIAILLAISQVPPHVLRRWTPWLYALGLVMVAATAWLGVGQGAQRWLDFGVVRFQPSEIMKLAVPMMVAWYLHPRVLPPGFKDGAIAGAILVVPALLIARQPDLGTALLVGVSGCFTLFLAGLRWRVILGLGATALAALPALWLVMHEYQRNRVRTFLNPESDPLGQGWNIIQSKIAVGSGGLAGKGWLNGTQSRLEFIPERHTDFILAVLAEEFGLVGVIALMALYLYIAGRGLYIASVGRDTWSRLVAGSLAMTLFVYVLVNGGMVSGVLPVVGVPLPLISYGGTSAVTLLAGFGIMMSVYGHRKFTR